MSESRDLDLELDDIGLKPKIYSAHEKACLQFDLLKARISGMSYSADRLIAEMTGEARRGIFDKEKFTELLGYLNVLKKTPSLIEKIENELVAEAVESCRIAIQ